VSHAPLAESPGTTGGAAAGPIDPAPDQALLHKHAALRRILEGLPSLIVAYSGGVDSAYLACVATDVLGSRALCVTADSPSYPDRHRQLALSLAASFGLYHEVIHTAELERPEYRANPANRCYYCKHELYTHLAAIARERGIAVIADGSNADDRGDYRPGRQAAREFGVRSPLDEAGLTKSEIRELARRAGLPTWDEPTRSSVRLNVRKRCCAISDSACSGCAITTRSRGSSSDVTRFPGRSSPTSPTRSIASCGRSATSTSQSICAATVSAA
jgi:uncharacterized protein (TIGR00268 family)